MRQEKSRVQVFLYEPHDTIRESVMARMAKYNIKCVQVDETFFERDLIGGDNQTLSAKAVVMSDDDGLGVERIRSLRGLGTINPIIAILMNKDSERAIELINAGADDVVIRPFNPREIVARVNAIIRRSYGHVSSSVTIGDITAYFDGRDPVVNGKEVKLSQREHAIFTHMALQPNRVITKESIFEAVYGMQDNQPYDKVVDVYICKLRKKLKQVTKGREYIETVYGRGYKLSVSDDGKGSTTINAPANGEHAAEFVGASA